MSEPIAILLASLSETAPGDPPAVERTGAVARNEAWWYRLRQHIGLTPTYKYLIDLPQGYDADPNKRWPLILFLHGSGERGSDLGQVRTAGLAGAIARGRQLPAIVVSPQCPANESWSEQVLSHLLDEVEANHRVDPDRVYVTGTSAGGDETWDFALAHPERLAAIVPMSGETDPADAARLQQLPGDPVHPHGRGDPPGGRPSPPDPLSRRGTPVLEPGLRNRRALHLAAGAKAGPARSAHAGCSIRSGALTPPPLFREIQVGSGNAICTSVRFPGSLTMENSARDFFTSLCTRISPRPRPCCSYFFRSNC
jgi:predicted esterase